MRCGLSFQISYSAEHPVWAIRIARWLRYEEKSRNRAPTHVRPSDYVFDGFTLTMCGGLVRIHIEKRPSRSSPEEATQCDENKSKLGVRLSLEVQEKCQDLF